MKHSLNDIRNKAQSMMYHERQKANRSFEEASLIMQENSIGIEDDTCIIQFEGVTIRYQNTFPFALSVVFQGEIVLQGKYSRENYDIALYRSGPWESIINILYKPAKASHIAREESAEIKSIEDKLAKWGLTLADVEKELESNE